MGSIKASEGKKIYTGGSVVEEGTSPQERASGQMLCFSKGPPASVDSGDGSLIKEVTLYSYTVQESGG